jgi:putative hydrolase of the HAD superfamily
VTPIAPSGHIDAVLFDLYGTLVPEYSTADFYASVAAMAEGVGADVDAFRAAWDATARARQTGGFATVEDNVRAVCDDLGLAPSELAIAGGLEPRAAMYSRWFHPRAGAVEVLSTLRTRGYPIALVSMCAPDTPVLWQSTELAALVDAEVFSSETGLRKPEPAIYLEAASRLGVAPDRCVYIGDGAYGELTGAAAVGMHPYLLVDPDLDHAAMLTPERDAWDGATIADLRDVLTFLPGPGAQTATP